jgi:DMSO/TMAO reductase YedYZ molybdopterin-dependent catalytic subunit
MSGEDQAQNRTVQQRMKLRQRFLRKTQQSPGKADTRPQGSGPPNRHGMPRLPVGQTETKKWPVLDLVNQPAISLKDWELLVDGACDHQLRLDWESFRQLEQVEDTSDFHCVTTWSKLDIAWKGVRVSDVLALAEPSEDATHLLCHAYDQYTTNLPLEEALKADVLLVYEANGEPLPREHGGPVRMITPQLYAWKGAKWIHRLELLTADRPGFWEQRGYSNSAHPWRNDRYSR